jgi:Ca2+-binding RTX toxin-like protein
VVSTGDAANDVSVTRQEDGQVILEVFGEALEGPASAGCAWDADLGQLACAADTSLQVRLGAGNDNLDVVGDVAVTASGEAGDDVLQGGAAASTFDGGDGSDALTGGAAGDRLQGGSGADVLEGGLGDDTISGDEGADVIDGGSGSDALDGGAGDDQIDGVEGADALAGGAGNDALRLGDGAARGDGGDGNDTIALTGAGSIAAGGAGDDTLDAAEARGAVSLSGGPGHDVLTGSEAGDQLVGGEGPDDLVVGGGADVLAGGADFDRVTYGDDGAVTVTVGADANDGRPGEGDDVRGDIEQVDGTADDDALTAGPAGTVLNGLDGDDRLAGGAGADQLLGGAGLDRLSGGPGAVPDTFLGGSEVDEVSYAGRTEPLTVDLSSREPVSGAPGEHDRFVDAVENVVAGAGSDRVTGQPGIAHRFDTGAGDDRIMTRELAIQGPDTAPDGVQCGDGADVVDGDRFDVVGVSCERVTVDSFLRRPEMIFGTGTQRVSVSRDGTKARVRVGCDRQTRGYCATRVLLRDPGASTNLARREIRIKPGKTLTVRLKAANDRRARKLGRRKQVLVVVAARDKIGRGSIAKLVMKTRRG